MMKDINSLFASLNRVEIIDKRKTGGWEFDEIADLAFQGMKDSGLLLRVS